MGGSHCFRHNVCAAVMSDRVEMDTSREVLCPLPQDHKVLSGCQLWARHPGGLLGWPDRQRLEVLIEGTSGTKLRRLWGGAEINQRARAAASFIRRAWEVLHMLRPHAPFLPENEAGDNKI